VIGFVTLSQAPLEVSECSLSPVADDVLNALHKRGAVDDRHLLLSAWIFMSTFCPMVAGSQRSYGLDAADRCERLGE
jgi:hypothetical protein